MRKVIGYYVCDFEGHQVAWHKTKAGARKIALAMARRDLGIFYTQPQYDEAA